MLTRLLAVLALAALVAPATAHAAQPAPLRTLSFVIAFGMTAERERTLSGLNIENPDFSGGVVPHSQTEDFAVDDSGRMELAVVAATADGGLVVDETYDGKVTRQAAERVAVVADGRLGHDPKRALAPAALYVLPLLARGLVAGRELIPGTSWTMPATGPESGTTTYRVTALEGSLATLAVTAELRHPGPDAYVEHDDGTIVYEIEGLVPRTVEIRTRLRRSNLDAVDIVDTHVTATLIRDSFAPR